MKTTILLILFLSVLENSFSQDFEYWFPTNSLKEGYLKKRPNLKYSYEKVKQTHDYSNNWDFDGDNVKDELYFIGNVGAHLYYQLRVILSSNKKVYDLNLYN